MEKELKLGQKVRSVDFKKTRAHHMKSACVWNWECPTLLSDVVVQGKTPHFVQFKLECEEFERNVIESIYEYRLEVSLLTKSGKECKSPNNWYYVSCTFNATDTANVMWEKILGMIMFAAKSKDSFDKFLKVIFEDGKPTVFRLDDNFFKMIGESVKAPKILSADDFMKYLDTFVDNPKGWSEATGEIEDIARVCTQVGKEIDGLDVSHAPVRGFGKSGQFKTPADWNKGYKGYIKDLFGKMSKRAQDMVVKNTHQLFND